MTDNTQPNITPPANVHELIKRATEIYEGMKAELEVPANLGKFVAIEVESGEHFLGDTREEVALQARAKYPDRLIFTRKIGEADKSARHSHTLLRRKYARAL